MPTLEATSGHTCVVVGSKVVRYGGKVAPTTLVEETYALDIAESTWCRLECSGQVPKARAFHTAVVHRNQMYVFGGLLAVGLDDVHYNLYNVFAHPDALSEEILGDDPTARLRDPKYLTPKTARRLEPCPLHCLDLRGQAWWRPMLHVAGDHPPARSHHTAALYRDKMFVHGGYSVHTTAQANDDELQRVYSTYFLDLETMTWRKVAGLGDPSPKVWGASSALSGSNWVMYGGVDIDACQETSTMCVINLEDGRKRVLALNGGGAEDEKVAKCTKAMHTIVRWGDRLVVFGGSRDITSQVSNEVWSFDLITGKFSQLPTNNGPEGRFGHSACVVGEEMYIIGGLSAKLIRLDDIWAFSMRAGKWRRIAAPLLSHTIDNVRGHSNGYFAGQTSPKHHSVGMQSESTPDDVLSAVAEGAYIDPEARNRPIDDAIRAAKRNAHQYDIGTEVSALSPSHARREIDIRANRFRDLAAAQPEDGVRVLHYWRDELDALHNESSRWLSSTQSQSTQLINSYFTSREGPSDMTSPSRAHSYEAVRMSQPRASNLYLSPSIIKLGLEGRLSRQANLSPERDY